RYSDPDGPGPYTFRILDAPSKGILGGESPNLEYIPNADAVGSDVFTWTVSDGKAESTVGTVTIRILAPNRAPTAGDVRVTGMENESFSIVLPFTDPDDGPQPYTFTIIQPPVHGRLRWLDFGRYRYEPPPGYLGTDSFLWKVSDAQADSNVAKVSIELRPDQKPPSVVSAVGLALQNRILVKFDERVTTNSAENVKNYMCSDGIRIERATLSNDECSVVLHVSSLPSQGTRTLAIRGVTDRASAANRIADGTQFQVPCVPMGDGLTLTVAEGARPPRGPEARSYTSGYFPVYPDRAQIQTFKPESDMQATAVRLRLARPGAQMPEPLVIQIRRQGRDETLASGRVLAEWKDSTGRTVGISRTYRWVTTPMSMALKKGESYELFLSSPLSATNAPWLVNAFYWDAYPGGEHFQQRQGRREKLGEFDLVFELLGKENAVILTSIPRGLDLTIKEPFGIGHDGTNLRTDLPGQYEVRAAGNLLVDATDSYTIYVIPVGQIYGLNLHLGGHPVVPEYRHPLVGQELKGLVHLDGGRVYPLVLTYRTDTKPAPGTTQVEILWSSINMPKQPIPASHLGSGTKPSAPE
ncbi:MAG: cadherin-like domain-containing protein, partial [Kiritimatiellae bacterium]|nr:cadherin-like domain-containing protein [Kiritimatiellia bacterium]